MGWLDWPVVARTRRHHGIEHATIHILSDRDPSLALYGRSDPRGFLVYGEVATETFRAAVESALQRLQQGERSLAVHPNCGTNLATDGILAGLAAVASSAGRGRSLWERLPAAIIGATFALYFARPLGLLVQERITTSSDVAGVQIGRIIRHQQGRITVHRVEMVRESVQR